MFDNETVQNLAAGATGSGLAAWMAKVAGIDLVVMFIGGCAAAHFMGAPIADYFHLARHATSIGFIVGFLSILIMRKAYETLQSLDPSALGSVIVEKFRKILG
jgi:hypothetical protein